MTNSYYRIRLTDVPAPMEDIVTTHCFESGALGVSEALNYKQPDLTYDAEVLHSRSHDMDVFFNNHPSEDFFSGLKKFVSNAQWTVFEEEHKDWLEEWKKDFKAFKLVQDVWVVPSWLQAPPEAKRNLFIDPGMAFGTGTHATTQIAAALIYQLHKSHKNLSLLDVGTGTAILALLAEQLQFNPIWGLEIDPEARRVARENILKNNAQNILIVDEAIEDLKGSFDVVVANIIDGVLVRIKSPLLRVVKENGFLIATGILKERDNEFFEDFTAGTNLKVVRRIEKDEWVGYWFKNEA